MPISIQDEMDANFKGCVNCSKATSSSPINYHCRKDAAEVTAPAHYVDNEELGWPEDYNPYKITSCTEFTLITS